MDFLLFSDHHAHTFPYGASKVEAAPYGSGMVNSRLLDSVKVLEEMRQYAHKHHIKRAVFLGDLFHKRNVLHTEAYNLTVNELVNWTIYGIQLYMLPGNHDYANRSGEMHALESLAHYPGIEVYSSPCTVPLANGITATFIPYMDDHSMVKDLLDQQPPATFLFAHVGIRGAKVGADYVLVKDHDLDTKDIPSDKYKACFFGHFHQHQQLFRNGWYVGATHQHNWGDANTKRGFLHVKVEEEISFEFIETTKAPRFHTITDKKFEQVRAGDFAKVELVSATKSAIDKLQEKLPDGVVLEVVPVQEAKEVEELALSNEFDPMSMLEQWAKANGADDSLTMLGKELYLEAVTNQ